MPPWMEFIVENIRCPVCDQRFVPEGLNSLGPKGQVLLVTAFCWHCKGMFIFALVPDSEQTQGTKHPSVTEDDVLNAHKALDKVATLGDLFKKG